MAVFFVSLVIVAPVIALISIGSNRACRKVIWRVIIAWCYFFLYLTGMPPRRMGTRPERRRYVVVANHSSYLDAALLFPAVPGYFRALGKKELSKIPVFGFIYKQIVLMVDRSSKYSRAKSMKLMSRALRHECSIAVFPEGTFNEDPQVPLKEFYDGAFRLAISARTPILPVLLPDCTQRWHHSHWWLSPGRNRIVYLPPVPVDGLMEEDVPRLKEKVFRLMEAELRKQRSYSLLPG